MKCNTNIYINEKQHRKSNFELLRIVAMILIVMSHYCVNSGIKDLVSNDIVNKNFNINLFCAEFMALGKVGVNVFFLISGYFMISRSMKWKKVWQLLGEVLFYNIMIFVVLSVFTKCHYSYKDITIALIPFVFDIKGSFVGSYLLVYILSPIINKCMNSLNKKQWQYTLIILVGYFTLLGSIPTNEIWNYFGWGITMYILGGYINKFGLFDKRNINWMWCFVLSLIIIWGSEIIITLIPNGLISTWYYSASQSNKFTVLICAVTLFMAFKNIKILYSKFINIISASSFGVYLISDNSDPMRQFLWRIVSPNINFYSSNLFLIHMILKVICIYIICFIIDWLRKYYLERPILQKMK